MAKKNKKKNPATIKKTFGDQEIEMTVINPDEMPQDDEIDETVPENLINFDNYNDLTKFYYVGIKNFCKMISLSVPPEFYKKSRTKMDIYSTRCGIKAMKKCAELLQLQKSGDDANYPVPKGGFKTLDQWYTDGIIKFVVSTLSSAPEYITKNGNTVFMIDCCIESFKQIRLELQEDLTEMTS